MKTYQQVAVVRQGGPECLQLVQSELREPAAREVRVRVLATMVSQPDVTARYGQSPFLPKMPFVPGYAVIGQIDARGAAMQQNNAYRVGDQVAALTVYGGYAEYIYLRENDLIPVPACVDPGEAIPLVLNYLVAYQVLHRWARVKQGDTVLVIGASGGVGTALLDLGRLAGLKVYGVASKTKHSVVEAFGAIPIDYRSQDVFEVLRRMEPGGLDAVLDGMGGDHLRSGLAALRRGGAYIGYGNPMSFAGMLRLFGGLIRHNLRWDRKRAVWYSTGTSRWDREPFLEDWAILFQLLAEGKIRPRIYQRFPILEAARANALLESGQVCGNVVLLASELLSERYELLEG